ncbi:hypothetical protein CCACVL1_29897 [Corchorus capsularis]|uniref:Uncharacterized protein n=1 Tax=Corchorus capsularis TaxID=210143 RepID=A0A1R3FZK6_COCAP|nr:hypothetical protein CCACVL1_29897 [Corchorus capsularis]
MSITHADTSLYQIKREQNSKSECKYLKPLIKIQWKNHFSIHNATSLNKTNVDKCTCSLKCHIVQTHQHAERNHLRGTYEMAKLGTCVGNCSMRTM